MLKLNVQKCGLPKLIVWGGFWERRSTPLELEELNSHASVTCYFLSQALSQEFNVVQIPGFYSIEDALQHPDAVAVLSTFQAGFTRLAEKDPEEFQKFKKHFPGRLCSIIDFVGLQKYQEDDLFTVLDCNRGFKNMIGRLRSRSNIWHMGWYASARHCLPDETQISRPLTIFLDHGHYAGDDYTHLFIEALNRIAQENKIPQMQILYQGNRGIEVWPAGQSWHHETYDRKAKVPWHEIQKAYAKSDIFCVTHRESAGLGVIEAAMSGAHILVPVDKTPFIRQELLDTGISYTKAKLEIEALCDALCRIGEMPHNRRLRHNNLKDTHDWSQAGRQITHALYGLNGIDGLADKQKKVAG